MKRKSSRLYLLSLLCSTFLFFSSSLYSQVTVNIKDSPLRSVLKEIEKKSNYRFFFNEELKALHKKVSLNVNNENIDAVMNKLLENSDASYEKKDGDIIMLIPKKAPSTKGKVLKIKGSIKDPAGEPIIGASVLIQGSSLGTITDLDGLFSIEAGTNETLRISYIGYQSINVPISNKNVINIVLQEDNKTLDEVVVIGYGTQRKKDLTGSVVSITGKNLANIPITNTAQALQGKVAGVNITSQDGRPNGDVKIRIRGGGSITQSNDPLFIVDGFPVSSIGDIPSTQIETMSILKDASSTAIYGARGANGVVLITTKSPKTDRITVTYDGYLQMKTLPSTQDVLAGDEYVKFNWELYRLSSTAESSTYEKAFKLATPGTSAFKESINQYANPSLNTNWMDEIYGESKAAHSHNISINGGTEKTKFNVNYNYVDDNALRIASWHKRQNLSAKLAQEINSKLSFDLDIRFNSSKTYGQSSSTNDAIYYAPVSPLGDIDPVSNPGFTMQTDQVNPLYNPKALIEDGYSLSNHKSLHINGAISWKILSGLTFKSEYGVNYGWNSSHTYKGNIINRYEGGPSASISKSNSTSVRFANTLNYQAKWLPQIHKLDLLIGQELNISDGESTTINGKRLPSNFDHNKAFGMIDQWNKNSSVPDIISNTYNDPARMASFFGRINYSLMDKYILTATLRADGSNHFAPSNRWGYFPAAALGWRINEEEFLKSVDVIDNLKLRVSYGTAGNDRIGYDLWRPIWKANSSGGYPINNIAQSYYGPSSTQLPNPDLKWETTVTRNLGLDFALFDNRIHGTIEGYWNTTKDLLIVSDIPSYVGYSTQQQNIGQTRNQGIELSLGGDIIRSKDFTLSADFNIAFNKSKIEKLADGMPYKQFGSGWRSLINPNYDYHYEVGKEMGLIRGYVTDGFYTTDDFNYNEATKTYTLKDGIVNSTALYTLPKGVSGDASLPYPGALKLKKISENNPEKITGEDVTIIGNTNPIHTGGMNLNASYKGFDLLLAFNWSYGNDIYNANKMDASAMTQNRLNVNISKAFGNRYRIFDDNGNKVTDPVELNKMNASANIWYPYQNSPIVHSWVIEDGSFLRLNNVTLGYTIPQSMTKKVNISSVRVYGTIYNAWLWTNYSGLDPEVDAAKETGICPGIDWNAYPRARTFTLGLNVTF